MLRRSGALVALLFLAAPCAAEEPSFLTELAVGFGREATATRRPLVVLDGTPTDAYEYSADGESWAVEVGATRWLAPVPDDGVTPLALLPWAARASSVSARLALAGSSRDSFGRASGRLSTYEVWFASDGTLRDADLSAEWFLGRRVALRGALAYGRDRETAASISVESPSGRADVSTAGTRSSASTGTVGVALRLGEHELSASGSYGVSDQAREDATVFTGSAQPRFSRIDTDGVTRRGRVAARLLFLDRSLAVDVGGEYALATSSSDLDTTLSGPFSKGRTIARRAVLEATWFPTRRLGVTAGFAYATRDASTGPARALRPSSSGTTRTLGLAARWFATSRVSLALSASRAAGDSVTPPGSTTFQRFDDATDHVSLGAALRF